MAKATTTIRQVLNSHPQHAAWFATTQALFNQVAAFYFEVALANLPILALSTQEALTALERLTHAISHCRGHPGYVSTSRYSCCPWFCPIFLYLPQEVACTQRASSHQGQKVHRAPTRASPFLEQVRHAVCWHVERADSEQHRAQSLDGVLLELAQGPHYRAGLACRWNRVGKPATCAAWRALVGTYPRAEEVQPSREHRAPSHHPGRNEALCRRSEPRRVPGRVHHPDR